MRRNAKETALDYERRTLYRQSLRFAEARGLHLVRFARTLIADRLRWTVRHKHQLADLGARLIALGLKPGLGQTARQPGPNNPKEAKPMVAGITTFPTSMDRAVEDRLAADPALSRQWEEVSTRFRVVFIDPKAAFRKVDVDVLLNNSARATSTLATLKEKPDSFDALKGRTGLLAGHTDKDERERAILNAPALARDLERYLRLRAEAERKFEAEERAARLKVAVDIPALSLAAKNVLERVRDAIDRNDLAITIAFALQDTNLKAELEGFARAISSRFGERTLLGIAASAPEGPVFDRLAAGMNAAQREELKAAWPLRAAQQLAAHERTTARMKQAEEQRLTQRQNPAMKL